MDTRPRGHAALRRGRHSIPGQPYLLTFVTHRRRTLFDDFWLAQAATRGLLHPAIWRGTRLWCWVLMPDHVHLLVQLGASSPTLGTLVRNCKAAATRALVARADYRLTVWERGFHDRALRCDENLRSAARYVIANPVRAGLVQRVGDYPFWDAAWLHHDPTLL